MDLTARRLRSCLALGYTNVHWFAGKRNRTRGVFYRETSIVQASVALPVPENKAYMLSGACHVTNGNQPVNLATVNLPYFLLWSNADCLLVWNSLASSDLF